MNGHNGGSHQADRRLGQGPDQRRTLTLTVQRFYLTERGRQAPRVLKRLLLLCGPIVLGLAAVIIGAAFAYGQLHVQWPPALFQE